MSLIIPEKIIKETLEIIIRHYYNDLVAKTSGVVNPPDMVNTAFTFNIVQQGSPTQQEEVDLTVATVIGAQELAGNYIVVNSVKYSYMLWFTVLDPTTGTVTGTQPQYNAVPINVQIEINDTDIQIANKIADAMNIITTADGVEFVATPNQVNSTINYVCQFTTDKENTLLWDIFGDLKFDNMNYFDVMSDILINRYNSEKRKLTINLGYDQNRVNFPIISILLPNEENNPKFTGKTSDRRVYGTQVADVLHNAFDSVYNLLITSNNQNEVIVVYNFLKTIILAGQNQFQLKGLQNPYISGRDITMDTEINPMMLFHRTVGLSIFYESEMRQIATFEGASNANFTGIPITPPNQGFPIPPSPNAIPNMTGWWKSTDGLVTDPNDATKLTTWQDFSPIQNDLYVDPITYNNTPFGVSPNILGAYFDNKPAIEFNWTDGAQAGQFLKFTTNNALVDKVSIMLVYEVEPTTAPVGTSFFNRNVILSGGAWYNIIGDYDANNSSIYNTVSVGGTNGNGWSAYGTGNNLPNGVMFRVLTYDFTNQTLSDYRNSDTPIVSSGGNFTKFSYDWLGMWKNSGGLPYWYGRYRMMEMIIYNEALSSSQVADLKLYADARYNTTF